MRVRHALLGGLFLVASCGEETPVPDGAGAARPPRAEAAETQPTRHARVRPKETAKGAAEGETSTRTADEWGRILTSPEATAAEREEAVAALVDLGEEAVPVLVAALADPGAADFALEGLAQLGATALPAAPAVIERMRTSKGWHESIVLMQMGLEVVPLVAKAAGDEAPSVRFGVASVLAGLAYTAIDRNDTDAARAIAEHLAALARDADERSRVTALHGLRWLWSVRPDVGTIARAALEDPSANVRSAAAVALSACPGDVSGIVDPLVRALDDPKELVAFSAATALRALGDRAGEARLRLLEFEKDHPEWHAFGRQGVGVDALESGLRSEDPEIRRIAAESLARMGSKAGAAETSLVAALDDASPEVRAGALDALAASGAGADAAAKVRAALTATDAKIRAAAARALARLPADDAAVADLVRGLADPSADVRRECAIALGRLAAKPEASVGPLVAALDDADPIVRASAATALGSFGAAAADASPDLRRCLAHADPWVRLGAATSLARIEPQAPETFDALAKLAVDANVDVRWRTAIALGAVGRGEGAAILAERLDDRDRRVRKASAESLGRIGPAAKEAVPALERMSKARDAELAGTARAALAAIAR